MENDNKEGLGKKSNLDADERSNLGFVKGNVDSKVSVVVQNEYEEVPSIAPQKIKDSKHSKEYADWCRADWSILVMEQQAEEKYGESISNELFRKLKNILKERGEVQVNYKATVLGHVEISHLNTIQEMRNLISLHFKRIGEHYEKEKGWQDKVNALPYVLGAIKEAQDALSRDLMALFQMELKEKEFNLQRNIKMGIVDDQEVIDIPSSKILSESDVKREIQKLTKEQKDKLRTAIFYLKGMSYLDTLLGFDVLVTEEYVEICIAHLMVVDDFSKVSEHTEMKWSEFPLFRARDVRVDEYVKMERVSNA